MVVGRRSILCLLLTRPRKPRHALALFGCPGSLRLPCDAVGQRVTPADVKIPDIRIELRSKRIPGTRGEGVVPSIGPPFRRQSHTNAAEDMGGPVPAHILQSPSWPRRRPSTTTDRERGAGLGQARAAHSVFLLITIKLMFVVDGRRHAPRAMHDAARTSSGNSGPRKSAVQNFCSSTRRFHV
jgi:hypothetical protein